MDYTIIPSEWNLGFALPGHENTRQNRSLTITSKTSGSYLWNGDPVTVSLGHSITSYLSNDKKRINYPRDMEIIL